jgi:hypothetical protein
MSYNQTQPIPHPVTVGGALRNIRAHDEYLSVRADDDAPVVVNVAGTGILVTDIVRIAGSWSAAVDYVMVLASTPQQTAAMDSRQKDWLEFQEYRAGWMVTRKLTSSFAREQMDNPDYGRIVGMGDRAIPPILHQLQTELITDEPDDWFTALWLITKEDPVPIESQGKIFDMAEAWLNWGLKRGLIDAGVGAAFSQSW